MKKLVSIVASVIGFVIGYWAVQTFVFDRSSEPASQGSGLISLNDQIVAACDGINETAPMMVDEMTRLDRAIPGDLSISYEYTLTQDIPGGLTEDMMKMMEGAVRSLVASNDALKAFRDNGVDMIYTYHNNDGEELFSFTIEH